MCALAMIPQLECNRDFESSVWIISQAYLSLEQGNEWMNQMKTEAKAGGELTRARLKVMELLSNAIMLDTRAFHITDSNWGKKFEMQLKIENDHHKAWSQFGPDKLFREVEERLAREGWDSGGVRRNVVSEAEHMARAIEVIEWGRKTWENVPSKDKGVIFLDSFLRGVQKLYIDALVKVVTVKLSHSRRPH
ncbi:hypothetical protein L218DRAFT_929118 [Marasmius fiardii PR-910]|nr:hypothetical protein L218DRAFT_929118 [Marasmius fiardii PR-910]